MMLFHAVYMEDLVEHLVKHHSDEDARIGLMEECAELTEVIARTFRPERNMETEHIAEEMAHVCISMSVVAAQFGVTPVMIRDEVNKKREKHRLI